MRVAYVCADRGVPVYGRKGCSIHVRAVVRAMLARGFGVDLFATRTDGPPPADFAPVQSRSLPFMESDELKAREQLAVAANNQLSLSLQQAGPFDLVYERYSLWSFAAMEYAAAAGVPGVLEVNAPLIEEQAEHRILLNRSGAESVARRVFAAASVLVAVSREVAAYLETFPEARGRIHVVPNGVDPRRFPQNLAASAPPEPGTFTIGFVGSMKPWHGLEHLVESFDLIHQADPSTRLLLVGDGKMRRPLQQEFDRRGVSHAVRFTDAVDESQIPGLLASMDVAVAPYPNLPHFYFSPLKVYEYMAAGLPVVASRIGTLCELIRDGENGVLCPPGDARALADAVKRLRNDPGLRLRLGRAGRATVLTCHTWDSVLQRVLELARLDTAAGRPVEAAV